MVTTVLGADGVLLPVGGATTHGIVGSSAAQLLTGTSGNDAFRGGGGGDTLIGGLGDDTYNVYDARDTVIEQPGEGIDTIASTVSYWLPANVENLTLTNDQTFGGGNALNNIINGGAGAQTLDGKGGWDVMTGGAGSDIFVLGSGYGHDVVTDFEIGIDKARLQGIGFTSFNQVQAAMTQVGADVKLSAATGEQLIFRNHHISDFSANDFQLDLNLSKLTQTFDDEFNTLSLNSQGGTWLTAFGNNNALINHTLAQNGEAEIYVDPNFPGTGTTPLGINPFSISNGVLNITANPAPAAIQPLIWNYKYTSGVINTKTTFNQQYGYFEMNAKLPPGNGIWPAFWLVPLWNSGDVSEIDILEQVGRDPYTAWQTTHSQTTGGHNPSVPVHIDNPDQFHRYGVLWDKNWITWYVDGVETSRRPTLSDQQGPMTMTINLAVGGYWAGYPDATTPFPATMSIDYVRAYQLSGTGLNAGADAYSVATGGVLNVSAAAGVLANDSDPSGQTLSTILITGPSHGTLSLAANGSFLYTPTAGYAGADSFVYRGYNGMQESLDTTVSLAVGSGSTNVAPTSANGSASGNEDTAISGQVSATDPDSASLTYALVAGPQHGTVSLSATGAYTYTPSANYNGSDSFTFTANDGQASSNVAAVSLTVAAVNDAPVATAGSASGAQGAVITGQLTATDVDSPTLTYALVSGPLHGAVTVNANGSYQYTPTAGYTGADSFTFKANDGLLNSTAAAVSLTVTALNQPPVAAGSSGSGAEDAAISGQVTATDVDSPVLTYALATGPQHGSITFNPNGSYIYTPTANYNGADSFTFTASDGTSTSNTATVSLTITPVNDAPVANPDAASVTAGGTLSIPVATLLANDSDVDGDPLTITAVAMGANPHGVVLLSGGVVTYTPNAGYTGADSFTYYVTDGKVVTPVAGTVSVTVNSATPTYTSGSAGGDLFDFSARSGAQLVAGNDGNDTITGGSGDDTINGGNGNDVLHGGPGADALTGGAGADQFVFSASDFSSPTYDSIADFQGAGNGAVAGDDQIVFDGFSAAASVTQVSVVNTKHTYQLTDGAFHGLFVVTYSGTAVLTAGDFIFINTTSGNLPPVSTADSFATAENTPLTVTAANGVLANDSDPNGQPLTAALVAGPSHGVLSLAADGSFSYAAAANYVGTDSFTYQASDGTLTGSPATVSLTITSVNSAPVAVADTVQTASGSALSIPVATLLANDTDADGDTLTITGVAAGASPHGSVQLANGVITYTPTAGFTGWDSFTYTVSDGHVATPVAGTVSVAVTTTTSTSTTGTSGNDSYDFSLRVGPQVVNSQAGNDTVSGGVVNDNLNGAAGADILFGNGGADTITGGAGSDIVTGGAGADMFVFAGLADFGPAGAEDRITDFSSLQADKIRLEGIDANTLVSGDQAFQFLGTGAFTGVAGQLHYAQVGSDLMVSGDINGDKAADFQFLVLGVSSLQASDFIL